MTTTTPPPPRLEACGLEVAFGGLTALDGVSFTVDDGETVALIGPNGAGKTTVFNAVCGLVRPRKGTVRLAGRPAPTKATRLLAAGVARTLQGLGLFERMTVLENVLVPLSYSEDDHAAYRSVGITAVEEGVQDYVVPAYHVEAQPVPLENEGIPGE